MLKITKTVWVMLVMSLIIFSLGSCKKSGDGADSTPSVVDDDVIYSPQVNTTIILGEGIKESDVTAIKTAYYKKVGKELSIGSSDPHKIIVGKTDDELSVRAYNYLSKFKDDELAGYVIYSDGRSVAIAFDEASFGENISFNVAIEFFVSDCMNSNTLKLGTGAVYKDSFDAIEKQEEREAASLERLWTLKLSQISSNMYDTDSADNIMTQLKSLYGLFNNDYQIVKWLANLYDPETGGFYYSNSARNNDGYLPDLESTSQALGIVKSILTGYNGSLTDYFGEEIAAKFVSFVKNMQDSNGYFYHPQWKELTDKNTTRRERDLLAALNILENFGASPTYDTPNGVKGEGTAAPVSELTLPLRESNVAAVSSLVASESDEIYIPTHLRSKDAFVSYLSSLDIYTSTESVCKTLNSELSLYLAIDELLEESGENYRLSDLLANYLTQNQVYKTGLWSSLNYLTTIEAISALTEIVKLYDGLGKCVPNYSTIFQTICTYLSFDEEPEDISDISTAWSALAAVVNNINTYKLIASEANQISIKSALASLYSDLDVVLERTRDILTSFARNDGSFSTTTTGSASEQLGMSVAVPLSDEGDMNATLLATKSIWLSVFCVLGVGDIPIFNTSDRMMFQKTLLDMGIIIKNEVKDADPEDFEGHEIGAKSILSITSTDSEEKYTEIVEGPEGMGNVLKLYSSSKAGQDQFHFDVTSSVNGASCYSYELDICVPEEYQTGMTSFIVFYNVIGIERVGNTVRLLDRSSQWDAAYISDLGVRAKVGEWFNLRVEYYPGTAETVRAKIYFNGECVAVSDTYKSKDSGGASTVSKFSGFSIYSYRYKEMCLLVDNVVTQSSYRVYTPEQTKDLNKNVDSPETSQYIHNFSNTAIGTIPSDFTVGGDASAVTVQADADNNRVLSFSEKGGELILPLDMRGSGMNSAVVEFDLTVSSDSVAGAKYSINFNEYKYKERCFASMHLLVLEENGTKYAAIAEASSGSTVTVYESRLSLDTTYRLRFQLFYDEDALVVSLDGEIIGISGYVQQNCEKYYMRETTIEALTSSVSSTIFIDNLVSECIKSDFEEMTAPDIPREEFGFDSEDGMELSGATLSGGELSFSNAFSDAYVKIPVNVRVNVPTMALVVFDVTKSDSGSITVYYTDSSDNIIAAFDLVKNNGYVEIYEHTANGRYPTAIYTESSSAFNFKIEYSPEKQGFNLFINDEYAVASSITYTNVSGKYEFEYLRIEGSDSCGFSIDNLYAERICGIFSTNSGSSTNLDNSASVMTYETSSFASLPSKVTSSITNSKSYLAIRESVVGEAASKVLEFCSNADTGDIIVFKQTQTKYDSNAAFFETDLMMTSSGGIMNTVFEFRNSSSNTVNRFDIDLSAPGANLSVTEFTGNEFSADLDIAEGEWFKLRLEYRDTTDDFNYDGKNDIVFRAYINGVLIGESHSAKIVSPASLITQVRVTVSKGMGGSAYFDNTALGQCNMEYDPPLPADTDTLTYEPGVVSYQTVFTFGETTSTAKISSLTDTEGNVNKVLDFYTSSGSKDMLSVIVTKELEGANAVMFETDILIDPTSDSTTIYLEPQNSSDKQPMRLILTAKKDGNVTVSASDISETVIGKSGEWIHLKVEYMNPLVDYTGDRKADVLYKVYVGEGDDEALVATGYAPYSSGSYYAPTDLTQFVFTVTSDSEAEILLDNTRFWQVEREADVPPVFDETTNPTVGDDMLDGMGWT